MRIVAACALGSSLLLQWSCGLGFGLGVGAEPAWEEEAPVVSDRSVCKNGTGWGASAHWREHSFPLAVAYSGSLADELPDPHDVVGDGLAAWNDSVKGFDEDLDVFDVDSLHAAADGRLSDVFIEKRRRGWVGDPDALAVAETRLDDRFWYPVLRRVRIVLNYEHNEISADGGGYDFRSILVHELGHALGMGHDPRPDSVMNPCLEFGEVMRSLSESDVAKAVSHVRRGRVMENISRRGRGRSRGRGAGEDGRRSGAPGRVPSRVVHHLHKNGVCSEYRDGVFVGSHGIRLKRLSVKK